MNTKGGSVPGQSDDLARYVINVIKSKFSVETVKKGNRATGLEFTGANVTTYSSMSHTALCGFVSHEAEMKYNSDHTSSVFTWSNKGCFFVNLTNMDQAKNAVKELTRLLQCHGLTLSDGNETVEKFAGMTLEPVTTEEVDGLVDQIAGM